MMRLASLQISSPYIYWALLLTIVVLAYYCLLWMIRSQKTWVERPPGHGR